MAAFRDLYEGQIIPAKQKGLCATVYTQLADVEVEVNGVVTYDRKVIKFLIDLVRQINGRLVNRQYRAMRT